MVEASKDDEKKEEAGEEKKEKMNSAKATPTKKEAIEKVLNEEESKGELEIETQTTFSFNLMKKIIECKKVEIIQSIFIWNQIIPELKQKQREERKEQKPWRKNMKSVESQEKEAEKPEVEEKDENILDPLEKYKKLSCLGSKENDPIEAKEEEVKKDDQKPWRKNMKKSTSKECKL